MSTEEDIQIFYEAALTLVKKAEILILEAIENREKKITLKSSETDFVTETDQAVEKLLIEGFKSQFPDHEFIGEEDVADKNGIIANFSDKPTWIIDPIDGTMNFAHSNPLVTISIALAINKKIVIGIISAPCIGKLFAAIKNKGATLNGKPMKTSTCEKLELAQCILEVWSKDPPEREKIQIHNFQELIGKVHSLRCFGSAALNLAFVAAGNCDIYCHAGIHVWDFAAGAILVSEAGGSVQDPNGQDLDLMSRRILVASTPKLAGDWMDKVDFKCAEFQRDYPEICPM